MSRVPDAPAQATQRKAAGLAPLLRAVISIATILGLSICAIPSAHAEETKGPAPRAKPLLAVLELTNKVEDNQELASARSYLTDMVRNRAKDLVPWIEVITRENIVAILEGQGKKYEECFSENECEVSVGQNLGADYVASGTILKFGGELRLVLKLHDTHTNGLLKGLEVEGSDLKTLATNLGPAVGQLLAPLLESDISSGKKGEQATTGELFLSASPAQATYQIDGGSAGTLGKGGTALLTLPLGKHRITLRLAGYQTAEREVLIQAGAPASIKETLLVPPPPQTAAGRAFLTVESTPPQATIFLDGNDTGKVTPANFKDLAPGPHEIVLKRALYLDHRESKVLADEEPAAVLIDLTPDFGDLVVESTPRGAAITLDGELREERTPARFEKLPSGAHRVELSLPRYESARKTMVIEPGTSPAWKAELAATFASVEFSSEPSGATIFVDDVELGQTPLARELDRGTHKVRMKKRLHAEQSAALVVEGGKPQRVALTLSARFGALHVVALAGGAPIEDAEVLVQGESRGKAPLTVNEIPEGVVALEVRAPFHAPFISQVKIARGAPVEVHAELKAEYGFVQARADQPATVEVDGRAQGPADGSSIKVAVGTRHISVHPEQPGRYQTFEREVVVAPLATEKLEAKLVARMGKLVVQSTPAGATVFIDGQEQGQTPKRLDLFSGPVQLVLKKDRYLDWSGPAQVREGQTESVTAEMKSVDLAQYESARRVRRSIYWGAGAVGVLVLSGVVEGLAHKYSSDESSALSRYAAASEPAAIAAARGDATSAASSARAAQYAALSIAVAAIIPIGFAVWNLVGAQ